MVQGIASGMAGKAIGKSSSVSAPMPNKITSVEELIGIMGNSGLNGGVVHGK